VPNTTFTVSRARSGRSQPIAFNAIATPAVTPVGPKVPAVPVVVALKADVAVITEESLAATSMLPLVKVFTVLASMPAWT